MCLAAGMAVMSVVALDAQEQVSQAPGAVLRGLDKINGVTSDIELAAGTTAAFGTLQITLDDCRYPVGNPAGNAYAALEISEMGQTGTLFSGWMVASAPALSAMDHPRYDVWVMSCTTS
ncbi:DUF2155 domain-containing protein [Sulfitobacter sabulilitoris]|uniref:DUF2155 domain-containing protein n=2 Tax=Sulfitobacter sabulilitoris TaxID=2562655 RepID=A0A5S3PSJ1_9RHOB|nr:DUF2155 domain-containing protein [Sulfitobacter sabulilitoris]